MCIHCYKWISNTTDHSCQAHKCLWELTVPQEYINNVRYWNLWDIIVSIATRLWTRQFGVQILAVKRDFSLLQNGSGIQPAFCSVGTGGFSPAVKWPRPEANHSPASNSGVKNEGSYTSTPPTRLHGICRYNFAITFACIHWIQCEFMKHCWESVLNFIGCVLQKCDIST